MPSLFDFKPHKTLAHRLDPRCKFFLVCLISAGLVSAGFWTCLGLLILALTAQFLVHISP